MAPGVGSHKSGKQVESPVTPLRGQSLDQRARQDHGLPQVPLDLVDGSPHCTSAPASCVEQESQGRHESQGADSCPLTGGVLGTPTWPRGTPMGQVLWDLERCVAWQARSISELHYRLDRAESLLVKEHRRGTTERHVLSARVRRLERRLRLTPRRRGSTKGPSPQ